MGRKKCLSAALAWLLAVVTAFTSVPADVYAAENAPVTQVTTQEETDGEEPSEGGEEGSGNDGKEDGEEGSGNDGKEDGEEGSGNDGREDGEGGSEEDASGDEKQETGEDEDKDSQDGEAAGEDKEEDTDAEQTESVSENTISENTIELEEKNTVTRVLSEDSFGRLLAQNIEVDDSESSLEAYGVSRVEITGQTAVVTYKAPEDADLVVAVYEEESGRMAASGHERVKAHGMTAELALYGDGLPQYYTVQAYLTDPVSNRPLCRVYKDEDHTRIMQEFYAKKESDFDQERLYSLDESEDNNFGVFAENVLIFHEGDEENKVVSADEDNQVYEFEQADEKLQDVQPGEIMAFFYQDETKTPIITKVYQAEITGTTVEITGMDFSLEEVFSFLKISADSYSTESGGDYAALGTGEGSLEKSLDIEKEWEDGKITGTLGIEATLDCNLWNGNIDPGAEVTVTLSGDVTLSLEDEFSKEFDFGTVIIPLNLPGLNVEVTPGLFVETKVALETGITLEKTIGSRAIKEDGKWKLSSIDEDWNLDFTAASMSGELYFGFKVDADACVVNKHILSIGLTGKLGPKLEVSTAPLETSTETGTHWCVACIAGEASLHGDLSLHAEVDGKEISIADKLLSAEAGIEIGSFYISSDADPSFGLGECPNKGFKCVVTVQDSVGNPVSGAVVNGHSSLVTNERGKVGVTPTASRQIFTASHGGASASRSVLYAADDTTATASDNETSGSKLYSGEKQIVITLGTLASQVKVKQVELSGYHQAVVTQDGRLYMWGENNSGNVGNGTLTDCKTPTLVKGLEDTEIREVQIEDFNSAAITKGGSLYMWGSNSWGNLGIGSQEKNYSAVAQQVPGLQKVRNIVLTSDHTAAITENGQLYMWGRNSDGQLGDGTTTDANIPMQPKLEENVKVKQVALGDKHTIALSTDGQVYVYGYNGDGRLGKGNSSLVKNSKDNYLPAKIEIGEKKDVEQVYTYNGSSAALTTDGELYIWGNYQYGSKTITTPTKVEFSNGEKVTEFVLCNDRESMALLGDGTVWMIQVNDQDEFSVTFSVTQIKNLEKIEHIYGSKEGMWAACNEEGDLYTWGQEYCGHKDNTEQPDIVLKGVTQVKLLSGYYFANGSTYYVSRQAAVTKDGLLYTWGYNGSSALVAVGKDNYVPQLYDLIAPVNAAYQTASVEASEGTTEGATSDGTAQYDGLAAGETYNFYVMKDRDAEDCLSCDNLLYIAQGQADDAGNLSFHYVMREACANAAAFIVAMGQKDISGAAVEQADMTYTGEELYPDPVVKDGEVQLVLGRDYDLEGDYIVKELGEYELVVKGIGQYKGSIHKKFKVVKEAGQDKPDPEKPDPDDPDPGKPDPGDPSDYGDVRKEDIPEDGVIPEGLWISRIPEQTYTGKAVKPEVRVYDYKTLLTEKKDYTIAYKNNTNANDGQKAEKAPTITINGKGNYTGKETQTFVIVPKDITAEDVTCDSMTVAYNSKKVQKPVPVVTWNGRKLSKNKDFTAAYPSDGAEAYKGVGVYDITVTGKGNYTGVKTISLTITEAKLLPKCKVTAIKNQTYTGTAITPETVVKDGRTTLVKDTDYSVSYENNREIGKASVILTGMGEYTGVKRVDFQIVPAVAFNKAKATLKTMDGSSYTGGIYTGEEVRPDSYELTVVVKGADKKNQTVSLVEGRDYTVSYQNNVKAGKATIVFTGTGGYKGTLKKTYVIRPYDIKADQSQTEASERKINIALEASYDYAKGGCKPEPVVTFRGTTLTKGTDYTLSYQNNNAVNAGENPKKVPTVIITGKGNFTGKATAAYKITQTALSGLDMKAADKVWQKKGGVYATKIEIVDVDGKKLAAGKDYEKTLVYTYEEEITLQDDAGTVRKAGEAVQKKDIIPAGTLLRVTASAKEGGNYSGELSTTYRITKADIGKAKVKIPAQTYTGRKIEPADQIEVALGGQKLAEDTDYEIVSYANNVNKGSASVTLRGIGDCGGTKTVKFTIKGKGFLWWWRG